MTQQQKVICQATPGKTGSWSVAHGIRRQHQTYHTHSLTHLQKLLPRLDLIIIGIREPASRNLSYFFEICCDRRVNSMGHDCYIGSQKEILRKSAEELYQHFWTAFTDHNYYKRWYNKCFDLLKIDTSAFNKSHGYTLFNSGKLNVLIYRVEDLDKNKTAIAEICGVNPVDFNKNRNVGNEKWYASIYQETKKYILDTHRDFPEHYIKELYDWPLLHHFYSPAELNIGRKLFLA